MTILTRNSPYHARSTCLTFVLAAALITLIAFWLRMFDLNTLPPGMHFDEAQYLWRSWRVGEGYGYNIRLDSSPEPFDPFLRGVFLRLAGYTPFGARCFSALLATLAIAATIGAAKELHIGSRHRLLIALVAGGTLAVIPAHVMFSRYIYRIHFVPVGSMLALTFLLRGWRIDRSVWFALAGVMTAVAAMFYLSGLVFPVAVALIMVPMLLGWALIPARRARGLPHVLAFGAGFGLTLVPWLIYFFGVPGFVQGRTQDVAYPITSIPALVRQLYRAFEPVYRADIPFLMAPRYNTFSTPYLNPILLLLLFVGLISTAMRFRHLRAVATVIIGVVFLLPAALTVRPAETIRLIGVFAPLALIVGSGSGVIVNLRRDRRWHMATGLALALVIVGSAAYTYDQVRYHFTQEPRLFNDPYAADGNDQFHYTRLRDAMRYIAEAGQPVYAPLNFLDYQTSAAWLRPVYFPQVRSLRTGESLPGGLLFIPDESILNRWPPVNAITGYVLLDPARGEIVLLPPQPDQFAAVASRVVAEGQRVENADGALLGHSLAVTGDDLPFAGWQVSSFAADAPPLAVLDDHLELLAVDAADILTPGAVVPVTFHWRLRRETAYDYFVNVQWWDGFGNSRGTQDDNFDGIYRWLYPTAMWQPGEVISEVRWVRLFDDAPAGGYSLALRGQTAPFPRTVSLQTSAPARIERGWAMIDRALIPLADARTIAAAEIIAADVLFDDVALLREVALSSPPELLQPGDALTVWLSWEVVQPPPRNLTIFVHLLDADGQVIAQQDVQPYSGAYPTTTWNAGTQVITFHDLSIPADTPPAASLAIGLYDSITLERVPALQDGAPLPDNVLRLVLEE
jgi:hypothetical protein